MTAAIRISLIGVLALWSCVIVWGQEFDGGLVDQDLTLSKWDSPFTIRKHIFVDRDVQLTIEDGVEMRFSPGIMIAVNGTLIAKGTETSRIIFTKDAATGAVPQWPDDIRLVDERSVHLGRLQLLYKGKWRGVCANFQNWTAEDTTVACRQLGFQRGNFSFVSYATNDSLYMLYHRPQCLGGEDNIWECAGANTVQIGSRICLHQQTIHLQCEYVAENSPARGNWWGLEFYNSTLRQSQDGTVVMNESASMLHHVDVLYAGVDDLGKPAPAIRASPWGPHLIDVGVRHSALDGVNYTDIHTLTVVHRSHFQNNRGHGANIESHFGHLSITDSTFEGNYGNGVKAKFVDGKYPIFDEKETFCRGAITGGSQRFPQMFVGIPNPETGIGPCERKFQTVEGQVITLNVLEMEVEEAANATLEVFDGRDQYSEKIGEYAITNGTLPQGISSSYIYMFVRFKWKALPSSCPLLRDCIKFTILVDTGTETVPELFINNTMSINNTQHGIFIENVRNYAYVNASTVAHNRYGAGIRVFGGAGDVHVNASTIQYNQDNGINMTYGGGWRIINQTTFTSNFGNGLNITVNETRVDNKTRYARHHRTEVSRSDFVLNDGLGVRVGNFCERSFVAINDSSFVGNAGGGVELESCFRLVPSTNRTNFTVAYNTFDANYGHAIRIVPLLNAVGVISNNTFTNHPRHVLLLDNSDDFLRSREFTLLPVDYYVNANLFSFNKGFYVAHVRLTEGSSQQKLLFQYNIFTDNEIEGGFPTLNTRTKANAVLIVSSTNVNFSRNHLVNPLSKFEIATHLIDPSAVLSGGAAQYWGDFDDPDVNYGFILTRIFDHYSRFSLARIEYHPVLRTRWLYAPSNQLTWDETPQEIEFKRGADGLTLGGRLTNTLQLDPHTSYTVDRDINVLPEGELRLQEGTELHFQNAVGMFVQGNIQSTQSNPSQQRSVLCLLNMTTAVNSSSVRLVGGVNELEGRLEVRPDIDQEWGTVCDVGWTATDASVVCQQLGYVLHPDEWFVYDNLPGAAGQPIWQSNVRCTQLDLDLTRCASDSHNDHSCTHERDVYVRCKPPTWAGVRLLATASGSRLYNMEVREAGLLDPTALLYSPAISIDYNVHTLEHLHIHDNIATGLEILHNDAYANAKLTNSVVERNFGNGVTTRGSFFEVSFSELSDNVLAGFEYNPTTTNEEALELRRGIHRSKTWVLQEEDGNSLFVPNEGYKFLITDELMEESRLYEVEFSASSAYKLVVAVLDWNPDVDQETITIFDGARSSINENTHRWRIEKDLVDFPIQSAGGRLTFRFQVHTLSSGRLTFVLRSKPNSWGYPHPSLDVKNTTLRRNEHGTVTRHYNQPSDQFLDLYFRHRWEYITFYGVHFSDNVREAMHVPSITKYDDLYLPTFEELQVPEKIAEINYEIRSCHFTQNGGGIKGEHNHVEFSNNVWIWEVTSNLFDYNTDGGFDIELPKVNLMQQELYNHSVDVNDTVFEFNDNFEFRVDGFYCNSSIYRNRFHHNHCKTGCVTVTGTEKDIEIHDNEFTENRGRYVLELYMTSHTPYTRWVDGTIMYNNFKRNMRPPGTFHSPSSSPSSYALGIKGLQNITIHRNLFANSEMDYEMVGGQDSSNLENYLDITENWWGTSEQPIIRAKIFDFDDWNNYAIAEYFPFLIGDNFDAPLSSGDKWSPELDPSKPLGGRIEEDLVLYKRAEPYIVERDLTVMFRASLLIEPGVEMQFYPNVGILVLGSLTLRGKEDDRIKLGPIEISSTVKMSDNATVVPSAPSRENREKRHTAPKLHTDVEQNNIQVRLNGGQRENEGFMEFYNGTERRWTIICDDSFNDRTAEVACRSMGLEASNVYVTRTRYYDMFVLGYPKMHEQVIEWFWRQTFICEGNEASLNECRYKQNYQLPRCMEERRYVFVRCGERNLAPEYNFWGNLRFCTPEYEHGDITPGFSNMENVDIFGAGILHEEKIAAIQSVHRVPTTKNVRVTNCAWNGYDYIAPRDEFEVSFNELHNNNGYAVGGLVLNGDSDYDNVLSSFTPLLENALPYNTYGLVRMCTTEKLVYVKERILLYFKYRFSTVDCIKIIRSREPRRQVALRFLQLNLYNDTFYKNAVEMYDGEYFDPNMLIGELTPNSTDVDRASRYQTSKYDQDNYYDTMGIRITASAAHGDFGFIAEVVTLPLSPGWKPDLGPGFRQHVHDTAITGNQRGAFYFQNAGELNPSVIIERCRIQDGGIGIYNLTAPHIMSMMVQNSRLMTIANNYIVNNAGGIFVNTTTKTLSTAVYANITNNVMVYNTHGEVLHLEGHHYQSFNVRYNYIAHNNIDFNNVVATFGIALNYSNCNMLNNTGMTIINASVPEQVSIAQKFYGNGIYDNFAIGANHTTIFLRSAKSSFVENYFLNRFNFFEMVTYNRTKFIGGVYPDVDATMNWWGSGNPAFISGRIWDRRDDDELIRVNHEPFHETNSSLLQGRCYPGWRLYEKRCYLYMGGVTPYHEAQAMCRRDRGTLARAYDTGPSRVLERFLGEVVQGSQENYDVHWRAWVHSDWQKEGLCTAIKDYKIDHVDCNMLLPYVCEKSPYVQPEMNWWPIIIALSVTGVVLLIVAILVCCAICKRQQRKEENFRRRDSLQRSLRASKASLAASNVNLSHDVVMQKKRRPPLAGTGGDSFMNLSGVTLDDTTDTFDKPRLDFHRPTTPASTLDYSSTKNLDSSAYFDSDLGPARRPRHHTVDDDDDDGGFGRGPPRPRHDSYDDDPKPARRYVEPIPQRPPFDLNPSTSRGYAEPMPSRGYTEPSPSRGYTEPSPSRGYAEPTPQRPQYDLGPGGYKKPRPMLTKPSTSSSNYDRPFQPGAMNYPLTLENEIAHVSADPTMYRNQAYDERSLDRSRLQSSASGSGSEVQFAGGRRPRPKLTSSRASIEDRPKPKETEM